METSRNPKNVAAQGRVQVALLPAAGVIHGAHACMEGARKYGPYNWRDEKIALMAYASAAQRHIQKWVDGEEVDEGSGAHHLGHAIATCAIALDALECGSAIDDRPARGAASDVLKRLSKGELESVAALNRADLECRLGGKIRQQTALDSQSVENQERTPSLRQTALDLAKKRFADGHKYVDPTGEQKSADATAEALRAQIRGAIDESPCRCPFPRATTGRCPDCFRLVEDRGINKAA